MQDPIHWGILGAGKIARKFATGLSALPDAKLIAVGSRRQETADAFGDEFDIPHRHAGYEALAADPDVDAIYVATPHPMHKDHTILCLEAGKAVLCEKPFAINAREAEQMIAVAREREVFLMEAMWARFFPVTARVREWLAAGAVGEVQMVAADFGFRAAFNPESRLFSPALGGGALLDVGVYAVSFASMVFGRAPSRIAALADLGRTGVDENSGVLLGYDGGGLAVLYTSIRTTTPHRAEVLGSGGRIEIPPAFWCPAEATLRRAAGWEERLRVPPVGNGYHYEAAEVMECLRSGRRESEVMPLDESLAILRTMDRIREQWGLRYPMEQEGMSRG